MLPAGSTRVRGKLFQAVPVVVPLIIAAILALRIQSIVTTRVPIEGATFPTLVGATALLLLYAFYGLYTGQWKLSGLYMGEDGRPSTSKFQALVWTLVVAFTYCGIFALRVAAKSEQLWIDEIPTNLMLAMGFSFTTVAAAKGITVSYLNSGRITKTQGSADTTVAQDDHGEIDLTKVQMLWWTFIAVGVYLVQVFVAFAKGPSENAALPNIDGALMVLMGLSHGVYVGKKLVTVDTPSINPLSAVAGPPGTPITITGTSFGSTQGTSMLTMDGSAMAVTSWTDTQVTFTLPAQHPTRGTWSTGQRITIDVIVNGRSSVAPVVFTVLLPTITSATPNPQRPQQNVTISGSGFGSTVIAARSVTVGGAPAAIVSWTESQIVATIPVNSANGQPWPPGTTTLAPLVVTVGSESVTLGAFSVS